jgi:hypothetical protein
VDVPAHRVGANYSKQPQHQEYYRNRPEHR